MKPRVLLAKVGLWPGDTLAPLIFVFTFCARLANALAELQRKFPSEAKMLTGTSPFSGAKAYTGNTGYVDDIGVIIVLPSEARQGGEEHEEHGAPQEKKSYGKFCGIEKLIERTKAENDVIGEAMADLGIQQNKEKQVNIPHLFGRGAGAATRKITSSSSPFSGKTCSTARYLGPILTTSSTLAAERPKRIAAAKAGWYTMGAFWASAVSLKMKKMVFQSMVQGAALSGLEAFAGHRGQLTQKDVAPIDAIILRYGRVLLQGKAVTDQGGKKKAKKTEAVWKMLRLVPSLIELRIRRLKWLQTIAGKIEKNHQLLTAWLGHFPEEKEKTITQEGGVHPNANPWAKQLAEDIKTVEQIEGGQSLLEEIDGNLLALFTDKAERFQLLDLDEFRSAFWAKCIAPIGAAEAQQAEVFEAEAADKKFSCCIEGCSCAFVTEASLKMHLYAAHGFRKYVRMMTVTNQCAICKSTFRNRKEAQAHITHAAEQNRCLADFAKTHEEVISPVCLNCPQCQQQFDHIVPLQWHIADHMKQFLGPSFSVAFSDPDAEDGGGRRGSHGHRRRRPLLCEQEKQIRKSSGQGRQRRRRKDKKQIQPARKRTSTMSSRFRAALAASPRGREGFDSCNPAEGHTEGSGQQHAATDIEEKFDQGSGGGGGRRRRNSSSRERQREEREERQGGSRQPEQGAQGSSVAARSKGKNYRRSDLQHDKNEEQPPVDREAESNRRDVQQGGDEQPGPHDGAAAFPLHAWSYGLLSGGENRERKERRAEPEGGDEVLSISARGPRAASGDSRQHGGLGVRHPVSQLQNCSGFPTPQEEDRSNFKNLLRSCGIGASQKHPDAQRGKVSQPPSSSRDGGPIQDSKD